jgi:hypothetical protein
LVVDEEHRSIRGSSQVGKPRIRED